MTGQDKGKHSDTAICTSWGTNLNGIQSDPSIAHHCIKFTPCIHRPAVLHVFLCSYLSLAETKISLRFRFLENAVTKFDPNVSGRVFCKFS